MPGSANEITPTDYIFPEIIRISVSGTRISNSWKFFYKQTHSFPNQRMQRLFETLKFAATASTAVVVDVTSQPRMNWNLINILAVVCGGWCVFIVAVQAIGATQLLVLWKAYTRIPQEADLILDTAITPPNPTLVSLQLSLKMKFPTLLSFDQLKGWNPNYMIALSLPFDRPTPETD